MARLLPISTELKQTYKYSQKLLYAYHQKQANVFFQLLREIPEEVPMELHNIKKTFFKYEQGIRLALTKHYSNAKL